MPPDIDEPKAKRHRGNVAHGLIRASEKGVNPISTPVIIDTGCSEKFRTHSVERAPTLTKTRCASSPPDYWCTTKGGHLTIEEVGLLQGFDLNRDLEWKGIVTKSQLGHMLGNAQSLSVVSVLLPHLWFLARLITKEEFNHMF